MFANLAAALIKHEQIRRRCPRPRICGRWWRSWSRSASAAACMRGARCIAAIQDRKLGGEADRPAGRALCKSRKGGYSRVLKRRLPLWRCGPHGGHRVRGSRRRGQGQGFGPKPEAKAEAEAPEGARRRHGLKRQPGEAALLLMNCYIDRTRRRHLLTPPSPPEGGEGGLFPLPFRGREVRVRGLRWPRAKLCWTIAQS